MDYVFSTTRSEAEQESQEQHTKHHQKGILIKPIASMHCGLHLGIGFVDSGVCLGLLTVFHGIRQPRENHKPTSTGVFYHNYNLYELIRYFHESQLTDGSINLKVLRRKSFLSIDPGPEKS